MDMVIIVEIVVGIVVFAGAVRFAVRDARERRLADLEQQSEPEHTPAAHTSPAHTPRGHAPELNTPELNTPELNTPELQERTSEREAEQHPSEVADRT
jgi:flagellar biosynthesis/type III secretory pathway M-ring protein FliF/YscJ